MININAKENNNIINILRDKGYAKNKTKTYIKLGYIYLNNKKITKLPCNVKVGDTITIDTSPKISTNFKIIYEDTNYLVVDKKQGLLTISTSNQTKQYEDTLYKQVRAYLNSKHEYAFIANRIDKETSGLVIFVKNEQLKERLQSNWNNIVKKRGYIAIISGKITKPGRIKNYLYEDKLTFSHSTKTGGKLAITNYTPIKNNNKYTMLDINIETGRKNQIRVHMSELAHPIIGDKKYKSKDNPLKRLALHHYEISLIDPLTNKLLTFKSNTPSVFYDLFN